MRCSFAACKIIVLRLAAWQRCSFSAGITFTLGARWGIGPRRNSQVSGRLFGRLRLPSSRPGEKNKSNKVNWEGTEAAKSALISPFWNRNRKKERKAVVISWDLLALMLGPAK